MLQRPSGRGVAAPAAAFLILTRPSWARAQTAGGQPTVEEARAFVEAAEERLLELSTKAGRAAWVQANFITDDTERIAADLNKDLIAASMELAKTATRFDGMTLPPELARKLIALDLLVRDVERRKLAATTKPRPPRGSKSGSCDVPAHVRRAVWKRDGGRCAFAGNSGRCTERRYLEWHHVQPFGHQGRATVENISLRCRAHNVYESELVFGRFDPWIVREGTEIYAVSREIEPFRNGASATLPPVGGASNRSRTHA